MAAGTLQGGPIGCSELLQREFFAIGGLVLDHSFAIAIGIDPDGRTRTGQAIEFGEHVEVTSMCAEKDVAGQGLESGEGVVEVSRNARVSGGLPCGDEGHARIDRPSTDDDDVEGTAAFMRLHGPVVQPRVCPAVL